MPASWTTKTFDLDTRKVWCPQVLLCKIWGRVLAKERHLWLWHSWCFFFNWLMPPKFTNTKSNMHTYICLLLPLWDQELAGVRHVSRGWTSQGQQEHIPALWMAREVPRSSCCPARRSFCSRCMTYPNWRSGGCCVYRYHSTVGDGDGWDGMEENKRMQL